MLVAFFLCIPNLLFLSRMDLMLCLSLDLCKSNRNLLATWNGTSQVLPKHLNTYKKDFEMERKNTRCHNRLLFLSIRPQSHISVISFWPDTQELFIAIVTSPGQQQHQICILSRKNHHQNCSKRMQTISIYVIRCMWNVKCVCTSNNKRLLSRKKSHLLKIQSNRSQNLVIQIHTKGAKEQRFWYCKFGEPNKTMQSNMLGIWNSMRIEFILVLVDNFNARIHPFYSRYVVSVSPLVCSEHFLPFALHFVPLEIGRNGELIIGDAEPNITNWI